MAMLSVLHAHRWGGMQTQRHTYMHWHGHGQGHGYGHGHEHVHVPLAAICVNDLRCERPEVLVYKARGANGAHCESDVVHRDDLPSKRARAITQSSGEGR